MLRSLLVVKQSRLDQLLLLEIVAVGSTHFPQKLRAWSSSGHANSLQNFAALVSPATAAFTSPQRFAPSFGGQLMMQLLGLSAIE